MTTPPLLAPDHLPDLSAPKPTSKDPSLSSRVPGGRTRRAVLGVIRSIKSLQEPTEPRQLGANDSETVRRMPWVTAEERLVFRREKKPQEGTAAERELEPGELQRLRLDARRMTQWVRAKKAGVTQEVVDAVRREWRTRELVMVKIVEPLCRNMDRAREIIEVKTGGLVVWSKNDTLFVYRRSNYLTHSNASQRPGKAVIATVAENGLKFSYMDKNTEKELKSTDQSLYEKEANRLLDGLGPRFIDWWWPKPLPVDADLLPDVIPGFKTPIRHCPPGVRLKLLDDELTYLRMLARPLPTHFALGKNSKLQGLAAAILQLWEKSLIAKIAVKVGIPNTNNAQMSCELKRLTGGTLILRNRFFIILYRGKDFLPGGVAASIIERETVLHDHQIKEETARLIASKLFWTIDESASGQSAIGTFREYQEILVNYIEPNTQSGGSIIQLAEKERLEKELKEQEHKLFILMKKNEKSEKGLAVLNSSWSPSKQVADRELLTEEERQTLRKIGLKMGEYLLLGRRGIYDGVVGNIHMHWKHREVVKLITKQQGVQQIAYEARLLEVETGGTLIAIEKLKSSHAIILYRGKNYDRPLKPLPNNLLTKGEALKRSIEIQRRGSLKFFARQRQQSIWKLKERLVSLGAIWPDSACGQSCFCAVESRSNNPPASAGVAFERLFLLLHSEKQK